MGRLPTVVYGSKRTSVCTTNGLANGHQTYRNPTLPSYGLDVAEPRQQRLDRTISQTKSQTIRID